jgi:uncharacterized protein (UPF0147 family)
MGEEQITSVIGMLRELQEDSSVPKNVKTRVESTIVALQEKKEEAPIKISRALHELESITEDNNMESYTRMQLLSIVSALEMLT